MVRDMNVRILAKDNAQPGNKEMVSWLETNFESLLSKGLRFKFRVLESEDEIQQLVDKGVKKLPVMFVGEKSFSGSIAIREFLKKYTVGGDREGPATPEEEFRDWQMSHMTKKAKEQDDGPETDERDMDSVKRRAEAEWQERQERHRSQREKTGMEASQDRPPAKKQPANTPTPRRGDNIDTPARAAIKAAVQSGDKDDKLLQRLFEET